MSKFSRQKSWILKIKISHLKHSPGGALAQDTCGAPNVVGGSPKKGHVLIL